MILQIRPLYCKAYNEHMSLSLETILNKSLENLIQEPFEAIVYTDISIP